MNLARLAAVLLIGTALTACSTLGGAPSPKEATKSTKPQQTLAADLDSQIANARALRGEGDYQGSTKILSQLMLVAPDNARVVGEYGKTLVQQGRPKEALDFLKRALELSPGDWSLYSASGVAYDQSGQYPSAKIAYQQALTLRPGNAAVLNNFALSRMQAGDLSGARQLFAQAQASGGGNSKIASNRALLASLSPEPAPVAQAKPAPMAAAQNKPMIPPAPASLQAAASRAAVAPHSLTPKPVETVMMEQIPTDPKAGPVKTASGAPRKLVKDSPPAAAAHMPPPAAHAATSKKTGVATAKPAPKKVATAAPIPKKVAAAAPKPESKKTPASNKTPALRMTADAATP
jgi:Flp pilus assembly protein TadD